MEERVFPSRARPGDHRVLGSSNLPSTAPCRSALPQVRLLRISRRSAWSLDVGKRFALEVVAVGGCLCLVRFFLLVLFRSFRYDYGLYQKVLRMAAVCVYVSALFLLSCPIRVVVALGLLSPTLSPTDERSWGFVLGVFEIETRGSVW